MRLGRLNLNSFRLLRSAVGLMAVAVVAVYSGGSVPNDVRRYIVTPQELTPAEMEAAIASHEAANWQSVGAYVAEQNLMGSMDGRERALVRAAYKQEIQQASADSAIRQRIRVPLLPGPVRTTQGPAEKAVTAAARAAATPAPAAATAAPAVAKSAPVSPLAEDLATIEALKLALKELKGDGLAIGTYRDDVADQ